MRRETEEILGSALNWKVSAGTDPQKPAGSQSQADEPVESNVIVSASKLSEYAVLRPTLYQRKGVFFAAARQWFAPAKLGGIQMLKAAKDELDPDVLSMMADDLLAVARLVFEPFRGIVAAPSARHSAFTGRPHFATELARIVADSLGQAHGVLFEPTPANRAGHHPAREKEPPKVIAKNLPMDPCILLVDDLATSGQTIELHTKALREAGAAVSVIVWCYSSTSGVGR